MTSLKYLHLQVTSQHHFKADADNHRHLDNELVGFNYAAHRHFWTTSNCLDETSKWDFSDPGYNTKLSGKQADLG